jgi:hypothetical protein
LPTRARAKARGSSRTGAGEATRMSEVGGIGQAGTIPPTRQADRRSQDAARRSGDHRRRETPAPPAKWQFPKAAAPREV